MTLDQPTARSEISRRKRIVGVAIATLTALFAAITLSCCLGQALDADIQVSEVGGREAPQWTKLALVMLQAIGSPLCAATVGIILVLSLLYYRTTARSGKDGHHGSTRHHDRSGPSS